ncbi:hypothetical protein J2I47_20970 [Fibrella sp. HMF5335]|uniref:Uncharacterized protein n=1 Tax=Fibrella rubiginis TaxID=2817060 RepID=A0A939K529_9BACT|nr:hypothetical protein [Fibrella rubiginis]MBO0939039.1 hypothetical protein [Fibrella rubiginis]
MNTTATKKSDTSTKRGRYQSVEDAVRQKQAALVQILAGADLTRFTGQPNGNQPTDGDVSDVPYEVK